MATVQIAGLASGLNWESIINELVQADSAGVDQVQAQQTTVNNQVTALGTISTDLTNLENSVFSLEDPSLYSAVSVGSSNSATTWQANATTGTPTGSYQIAVGQLATASVLTGGAGIAQTLVPSGDTPSDVTLANLDTWEPVTAGTFTVDGQQITVTTSESLQDVFNAISTATGGDVTATYDSTTDKVTLASATDPAQPVVLGAANDTSNFLQAFKLQNDGDATSLTSSSALGSLSTSATLADSGLATALTGQDGSGNGSFTINGVSISYNVNTDTLSTLISRIDNSGAGVTASYNAYDNQMVLTNTSTGDVGMGVQDVTGNLAAALGLTSGTGASLAQGANTTFTVNGGPTQTSMSNTLSSAALGVPGLTVTVDTTDTQTLTVSTDTTGIQSAIQSFLTAFNQAQTDITNDTQITVGSDGSVTTSILSDDEEVGDWGTQLENTAFSAGDTVTGGVNSLESLGIDFSGTTGQLEITDQGQLLQELSSDTAAVAAYFQTGTTGFGAELNSAINSMLGEEQSDVGNLQQESQQLGDQISTMQQQVSAEQQQLESEFQAMESFESQYQSELSALNAISGSTSSSSGANSALSSNVYVNGQQVAATGSSGSGSSTSSSGTSSSNSSTSS